MAPRSCKDSNYFRDIRCGILINSIMELRHKEVIMLKKMKMPKPKQIALDEMVGDEMADEMADEEMADEMAGEEMDEMEGEEESELASLSDEELLAEVKKRGLMSQLEEEEGEEAAEDAYV
jgi:hypothetical protein